MNKYKFVNFGGTSDNESDNQLDNAINDIVKKGYEIISHSTDRYWGLTIIFKKIE